MVTEERGRFTGGEPQRRERSQLFMKIPQTESNWGMCFGRRNSLENKCLKCTSGATWCRGGQLTHWREGPAIERATTLSGGEEQVERQLVSSMWRAKERTTFDPRREGGWNQVEHGSYTKEKMWHSRRSDWRVKMLRIKSLSRNSPQRSQSQRKKITAPQDRHLIQNW